MENLKSDKKKFIVFEFFFVERACYGRIYCHAAAGLLTADLDASEFSENSTVLSTLNDENVHLFDTSDIHQKGFLQRK
jgi:hypothetical protein